MLGPVLFTNFHVTIHKYFKTWYLIGWQLSHQAIRSLVRKSWLPHAGFNMDFDLMVQARDDQKHRYQHWSWLHAKLILTANNAIITTMWKRVLPYLCRNFHYKYTMVSWSCKENPYYCTMLLLFNGAQILNTENPIFRQADCMDF